MMQAYMIYLGSSMWHDWDSEIPTEKMILGIMRKCLPRKVRGGKLLIFCRRTVSILF